ncbi:MAG: OFA family MFS transporter [Candidatus Lokiarchaeota archaeon]|nr:OFA family MFS transporter [Candidatus Lokiarchaeota archaeon]
MFEIKIRNRWIVVIGAVLIQLALGTIYSWGNLTPYFTSYLQAQNSNILYQHTQYIFAVGLLAFAVTMIFSGKLQQKMGPMTVGLIGAVLMSLGVILTFFMKSFVGAFFTYGILFGIGIGFAYVCPIACAAKWFPDKKGLINGIAVAGFGAGAFIFNLITKAFINPNNLDPTIINTIDGKKYYEAVSPIIERVPWIFLLLGGIYLLMTVGGSFLLQNPEEGYCPPNWAPPVKLSEDGKEILVEIPREKSIRTPQFWMLWGMFILTAAAGLFTIGNFKTFGLEEGLTDVLLTQVGAWAALFNGLGRIFWGFLSDKLGYKKTMFAMFGVQAILMVLLPIIGGIGWFFFIVVNLIYFCFGGNFSLYPTATADTFGIQNLGPNYGLVFTAYGIAGIAGALLSSVLGATIGFIGLFIIMGVLSLGAIGLAYFLKPPEQA